MIAAVEDAVAAGGDWFTPIDVGQRRVLGGRRPGGAWLGRQVARRCSVVVCHRGGLRPRGPHARKCAPDPNDGVPACRRLAAQPVDEVGGDDGGPGPADRLDRGPSPAELLSLMEASGGVVLAPASGYLQFIRHRILVRFAAKAGAVISLEYRPGHFIVQGQPFARVWPPEAVTRVSDALGRAHVTGPYRTLSQDVSFGVDQLVEIAIRALSPAVNDTFTALTCIDWLGDNLCKITSRWRPARVHRDEQGFVRVVAAQPGYERLVQRAGEQLHQRL